MRLEGCMTAMITPMLENQKVDYEGLANNVEFQIKSGISGLVPLGTTGESPTISESEREEIVRLVVEKARGRVPVIVGTGSNSTEKAMRLTRQAEELGADAALVVSPYYNKPTQECLYRHFTEVAGASGIPVIVYNIQGRTGVNIETPTLKRIAEHENIVAVKEASGSLPQMMQVLEELPEPFTVLSGDDSLTFPLMSLGGKGVISVVSNLFPEKVSEMAREALRGNFSAAHKMHCELLPIFNAAFIETNPMPIKAAMRIAGMPSGPCRAPLYGIEKGHEHTLSEVLSRYIAITGR